MNRGVAPSPRARSTLNCFFLQQERIVLDLDDREKEKEEKKEKKQKKGGREEGEEILGWMGGRTDQPKVYSTRVPRGPKKSLLALTVESGQPKGRCSNRLQ